MAAVLAPVPAPLHRRRRTLHDGALLLANQAVNLVNVPAATNAADDIRAFVASLKPRMLQAPGENDQNAREQLINVQRQTQPIIAISQAISQLEGVDTNGTATDFLGLLDQLNKYLSDTGAELQDLQQQSLTVKFARQAEITRLIDARKEETLNRIMIFCFENGLLANYASARTQTDFNQFMGMVNRRFEDEMLGRDEVNRLVEGKVNAILRAKQIDGRNPFYLVMFGNCFFF
ncbi:hypothetical protein FRC12_015633 [Ceratobasidium sp. 428]|nr:hypothetical protein FRC12_015633 [Ceratobasidium sp. 428]